jgi:hypothetical protein
MNAEATKPDPIKYSLGSIHGFLASEFEKSKSRAVLRGFVLPFWLPVNSSRPAR